MVPNTSWVISIANSAAYVAERLGDAPIDAIFQKYNAHDVEDLMPCHYSEVFSELYALETNVH